MARSIWSGAISFGLVNIPVKLFSAVSQKEVHFNMLHEKDGSRIQQKRVCAEEGTEVPWDEIAKGYEVSRGKYVMVTREELEALDPKATRAIEIEDFVDLDEIDPIFYETTYYAAPDRGADRSYTLLFEAMKRTKKVAIARVVLRTKQYLCAIRPMGRALAMSTMLYADEVRDIGELDETLPDRKTKVPERELAMAEQLVESLSAKFDPEKYKDEHRERVLEMLKRKAEGEEIVTQAAPERPAKVVNLADALERSLAAARGGKGSLRHRDEDEARPAARRGRTGGKRAHHRKAPPDGASAQAEGRAASGRAPRTRKTRR